MTDTTSQPYRVLARKYRPATFDHMIGQDALVQTLTNAIALGRLAHAFILTGVRGIGKTSTARILAKGLNCEGPDGKGEPTMSPCGQCGPCKDINDGRHIDVLEMDAASNTGVDDVRDIIDGSAYKAVSARFKIYIIDEVHMLSRSAFNALLKTLEEPPDNVKFIFATTEIRKVPVTILSRCQRFDLRRVPVDQMSAHLHSIAEQESIKASPEALNHIAKASEGSVRDALSLLDQAAAMSADEITEQVVLEMLGQVNTELILKMLQACLDGKSSEALDLFAKADSGGAEPNVLIADMLDLLHLASLLACGASVLGQPEPHQQALKEMAETGIARLGRAWQVLLNGHRELLDAPNPKTAAQMLLIRLTHIAPMPTPAEIIKSLPAAPQHSAQPVLEPASSSASAAAPLPQSESTDPASKPADTVATPAPAPTQSTAPATEPAPASAQSAGKESTLPPAGEQTSVTQTVQPEPIDTASKPADTVPASASISETPEVPTESAPIQDETEASALQPADAQVSVTQTDHPESANTASKTDDTMPASAPASKTSEVSVESAPTQDDNKTPVLQPADDQTSATQTPQSESGDTVPKPVDTTPTSTASEVPAESVSTQDINETPVLPQADDQSSGLQMLQTNTENTSPATLENGAKKAKQDISTQSDFSSLQQIATCLDNAGELFLSARVRKHLRPVSFAEGKLEVQIDGDMSESALGDLASFLTKQSGRPWLVSPSQQTGGPTLFELDKQADEKNKKAVESHPIVAAVLNQFADSEISAVHPHVGLNEN